MQEVASVEFAIIALDFILEDTFFCLVHYGITLVVELD